jgi:hypothetical protein
MGVKLDIKGGTRLKVFENSVPRRIFSPKRGEIIEGRRKLHNEELRNVCSSQNVTRMIKSRRMRRAGHLARMRIGMHIRFGCYGLHSSGSG